MNKMRVKEARNIMKELINMVVSNSELVSFNHDDFVIELETKNYLVKVWLDYNKGLLAYVHDSCRGVFFLGLLYKIDDCSWLKDVWEDIAFNNGSKSIQYFKKARH